MLFRDEAQIRAISPDMTPLQRLDLRRVAITPTGKGAGWRGSLPATGLGLKP
ncbi:hypothetical protein [Acidithiobacillus ferrivorans]|uniref:Uncharacterized protein n=1 Tax=Acidithiobacillus ferrivorans TaxID=160808 RepID=A0A7T4WC75_9PROT|nr:hypothetical protein [Acidithiobacillus ferrivorans]QQD71942.1 hypothetical protein H2515_10955 [Acidithiobacillus ferrivorans]